MSIFMSMKGHTPWSFKRYLRLGLATCAVVLTSGALVGWQFVAPAGKAGPLVPFRITPGEGVHQVSDNLYAQHLVRSQFWFETWVWLTGTEGKFQAGEYYLPPQVNTINLVRLLTGAAEPTNEVTLTLIEGWRFTQMADYLKGEQFTGSSAFRELVATPKRFTPLLQHSGVTTLQPGLAPPTLEGYLFPDTYRLFRTATAEDLVLKMLMTFVQRFDPTWGTELGRRGITLSQAVTMASIVEREVKTDEDRAMVADIFWRRLKAGQGLEADSTINYITGKADPAVSAKDLNTTSPYNTYRYRGLPPGPISNPGVSALKATVYPKPNPYWYFLTTPGGEVIYSKTFAEHLRAKQRYIR